MIDLEQLRAGICKIIADGCEQFTCVLPYSGRFSPEESVHISYLAPACFVTLTDVAEAGDGRDAYIITAAAYSISGAPGQTREQRDSDALCLVRCLWEALDFAQLKGDCTASQPSARRASNLFNRDIDSRGQTLWGLRFDVRVTPTQADIRAALARRSVLST